MEDRSCLDDLLKKIRPDEIYNLAAQSHVRISFDVPEYTIKTNALRVFNILEAYRLNSQNLNFIKHLLQRCLEDLLKKWLSERNNKI